MKRGRWHFYCTSCYFASTLSTFYLLKTFCQEAWAPWPPGQHGTETDVENKAKENREIVFEIIAALEKFGLIKITDIANCVYESAKVLNEIFLAVLLPF